MAMSIILQLILKTFLTKLVTEKVLIGVFLHVATYLVSKTSNQLDDKLVEEIKTALK
jgi:hypothetical protein